MGLWVVKLIVIVIVFFLFWGEFDFMRFISIGKVEVCLMVKWLFGWVVRMVRIVRVLFIIFENSVCFG